MKTTTASAKKAPRGALRSVIAMEKPKSKARVTAAGVIFTELENRAGLRARDANQPLDSGGEEAASQAHSEEQECGESIEDAGDSELESVNVPESEVTPPRRRGRKRKGRRRKEQSLQ